MGNYKLRLSDMIPNAWFYKLKEMKAKGRARDSNNNSSKKKPKEPPPPPPSSSSSSRAASTIINPSKSPKQVPQSTAHYPRKTYYFSRELLKDDNLNFLPDQPRKSSKHTSRRRPSTVSPKRVSSAGCSCRTTITAVNSPPILSSPDEGSTITTEETEAANSLVFRPELIRSDRLLVTHSSGQMLSSSTRHREKIESDSSNDIVIDEKPPLPEIALSPIVTKQVIQVEERRFPAVTQLKSKLVGVRTTTEEKKYNKKERGDPTPSRIKQRTVSNSSSHSPGIRLRINSPRIAGRRSFQQVQGRRSLSSSRRSLAVVKSSVDPQRDFRESMVEMIVENNLTRSKDLEELLACYLSLNADEYHDLIIKVFKQIWFDLTHRANT